MKRWIITIFVLFILAGIVYAENSPGFNRQVIQVPMSSLGWVWPYWKDLNKDGLTDLLLLVVKYA